MKVTRVQEEINVLKASVEDAPVAKKAKAKESVRAMKAKKVVKAKN